MDPRRLPWIAFVALVACGGPTTSCSPATSGARSGGATTAPAEAIAPRIGGVEISEPDSAEAAALAQELTWWRAEHGPLPLEQARAAHHERRRGQIDTFYAVRDGRPAWIGPDGPRPALGDLLGVLRRADDHGLVPADYQPDALEERIREAFDEGGEPLALEVAATEAALHYGDDLALGRIAPGEVIEVGALARRDLDVGRAVATAVDQGVADALPALAPVHPDYEALRRELIRLRDAPGDTGGPAAGERLDTLVANLERWRWLPDDLGDPHVQVDIAQQVVTYREGHRPTLRSPVIVGREAWPTPLFSDRIERVVINPSWHPPDSIERAELIPKAKERPESLAEQDFVVHHDGEARAPGAIDWSTVGAEDVRFEQLPGPGNALGTVKLEFPNAQAIYLHDTPHQALFDEEPRTFSHGCIRVERIEDLAAAVHGAWTAERIAEAVASGEHQELPVEPPVPVHLLYWTATVDADGAIVYAEDVYELDARTLDALEAVSSAVRAGVEAP